MEATEGQWMVDTIYYSGLDSGSSYYVTTNVYVKEDSNPVSGVMKNIEPINQGSLTQAKFDIMFDFEPPIIAKAKIECVEYGASLAIKIKECVEVDGYSIENFLPKAQIDAKEGWRKIVNETKRIRKGLSRIVCSVLAEDKTKFLSLPFKPYWCILQAEWHPGGYSEADGGCKDSCQPAEP